MMRTVMVTDDRGKFLLIDGQDHEPAPGSVVLVDGPTGTAYQRWTSDGMWHQCGRARAASWPWIKAQRRVVLVHDAPERA